MAYTKSQIKTTTIPFTIDYVVVLCQMGKKGHNRQPCRHNIRKSWQGKNRRKPSTGWCFLNFAVTIVELHHKFLHRISFLFRCETQLLEWFPKRGKFCEAPAKSLRGEEFVTVSANPGNDQNFLNSQWTQNMSLREYTKKVVGGPVIRTVFAKCFSF